MEIYDSAIIYGLAFVCHIYMVLVKHPTYGQCNVKKETFIDLIFYFIINDTNEYSDLTECSTLNLDYCSLMITIFLG